MERLQKILAAAGICSRRSAEKLILDGRVAVNGEIANELGRRVDPENDIVAVDGEQINRAAKQTFILNKPAGIITTCSDKHARATVLELLPPVPGLHPVGRLDKDTTGLLLLTNDGELTYALTHPSHHVEKCYLVRVTGIPDFTALRRLREGIELADGITAPATVRLRERGVNSALVELTIHEGRNRQVRRMMNAVGHHVRTLTRQRLGPLSLGDLPLGKWRELTKEEIQQLLAAVGDES